MNADARGDAVFQVLGDAVDQRLTELERGKNDEDNAFHQDGGEGDLQGLAWSASRPGRWCRQNRAFRPMPEASAMG